MSDKVSTAFSTPAGAEPSKIVLTLSGGGMRAVIFHLGVVRRLAASGLLEGHYWQLARPAGRAILAHKHN